MSPVYFQKDPWPNHGHHIDLMDLYWFLNQLAGALTQSCSTGNK